MKCEFCNQSATNGQIIDGVILHANCIEPYNQSQRGRSYRCIQCKTAKKIQDKSRKIEEWIPISDGEYAPCAYNDCRGCQHCGMKPIQVHPMITCPTCNGHGYTEAEYEPTYEKVLTGYKRKK